MVSLDPTTGDILPIMGDILPIMGVEVTILRIGAAGTLPTVLRTGPIYGKTSWPRGDPTGVPVSGRKVPLRGLVIRQQSDPGH